MRRTLISCLLALMHAAIHGFNQINCIDKDIIATSVEEKLSPDHRIMCRVPVNFEHL